MRALGRPRSHADQPDVDAPLVHLGERRPRRRRRPRRAGSGTSLNMYSAGNSFGGLVLARASSAAGSRRSSTCIGLREADHQVDRTDVGGHGHAGLLSPLWGTGCGIDARKSSTSRCSRSPSARRSAGDQRSSTSRRWASRTAATPRHACAPGGRDLHHDHPGVVGVGRPAPRSRAPAACAPADRSTPRPCRWTGPARRAAPGRARRSGAAARRRGGTGRRRPPPRARRARCGSPAGGRAAPAPAGCGPGRPRAGPYRICLSPATRFRANLRHLRTGDLRFPREVTQVQSGERELLADELLGEGPEAGGGLGVARPAARGRR